MQKKLLHPPEVYEDPELKDTQYIIQEAHAWDLREKLWGPNAFGLERSDGMFRAWETGLKRVVLSRG